ncbi:MAG: hypothetical protein NT040_08475 [Bacteroidetes bacterium]|nr:hypothetical protein [Bacteroidota bacterium]
MKIKPYLKFIIGTFLLITTMGYGANPAEKGDTLNPQQMLKQLDSIREKLQAAVLAGKSQSSSLMLPTVIGIESSLRSGKLAVYGDYISIKIDSIDAMIALTDSIAGVNKDTLGEVILYINGNPMRDIGVMNIDRQEHELIFHLDRHSKYLLKFYPEFPYLWSSIPVTISAGYRSGLILPVAPAFREINLKYVSYWSMVFSMLFILTIMVSFVVLAAKTNLIRIGNDNSPFSLALTQLSFWSIVVASSFIYIWIVTEELPPITGSTLILISVSALTTAGSRLVDIRTKTKGDLLQQSDSFLEDILQDELGYSVHRAQMFMWTVIMGIIFVVSVIRLQQIPQLDESLLGLMGISSGAYVGLKTMENKKDPETEGKEEGKEDAPKTE